MSRYTGPKLKLIRRFKTDLPGLTRKSVGEKKHPPGQHGPSLRPRETDYGRQLTEKQKVKFNYGITECQMKRYFKLAHRSKLDTGKHFLALLEARLDNAVFRCGFAPTIPSARQLVAHGHILLNGKRVTIPSIQIKPNDTIVVNEKARNIPSLLETMNKPVLTIPDYLQVETNEFTAKVTANPERTDVPLDVEESLLVEYYARAM